MITLSRRYVRSLGLGLVTLGLGGCGGGVGAFIGWCFSFALITVLIAFVLWVIACVADFFVERQRRRERKQQEAFNRAPGRYNHATKNCLEWLPQCRNIHLEEWRKARSFDDSQACQRARKKSLELLKEVSEPLNLVHEASITRASYRGVEKVNRLSRCCEECPAINSTKKRFVCAALSDNGQVDVDLEFKTK